MIQLKDGELWALGALTASANNAQQELQRLIAARNELIKLLEERHNATFDANTGQFKKKEE